MPRDRKHDPVVVLTACTFFSESRRKELLKARAFVNNVYILRVNSADNHKAASGEQWSFYGDSMLISRFGDSRTELNLPLRVIKQG